jgi:phage terminase large subunit
MEIDKKTIPESIYISIPNDKKLLNILKDKSNEYCDKDEEGKSLLITEDAGNFEQSEYYFDSEDNSLRYSGDIKTIHGNIYISITLPLRNIILKDILDHAINKFNNLKTVIDAIK